MTNLKYVDFLGLPKLRIIGTNAFTNIKNLSLVESIGNDNSVLIMIRNNAFNQAFSANNRPASLNVIHIPGSVITFGWASFAYQDWSNSPFKIGLQIGSPSVPSELLIPTPAPSARPNRVAYYFAGNDHAEYGDIDFYSSNYAGDDNIYDTSNEIKSTVADMFGFLTNSYQAMPKTFTVYNGANANTIIFKDEQNKDHYYNGTIMYHGD